MLTSFSLGALVYVLSYSPYLAVRYEMPTPISIGVEGPYFDFDDEYLLNNRHTFFAPVEWLIDHTLLEKPLMMWGMSGARGTRCATTEYFARSIGNLGENCPRNSAAAQQCIRRTVRFANRLNIGSQQIDLVIGKQCIPVSCPSPRRRRCGNFVQARACNSA